MKKLENELTLSGPKIPGLTAKLVKREGDICWYLRNDGCHEVFIVKKNKAKTFPSGKFYPDRESYPGNNDFGFTAWAYPNAELAQRQFEVLLNNASAD